MKIVNYKLKILGSRPVSARTFAIPIRVLRPESFVLPERTEGETKPAKKNWVLSLVSNVIFGLILVISLFLVAPVLPIPGNYQVRIVLSGSMEPDIKTGSIVFTRPAEKYGPGDVITFTSRSFKNEKNQLVPVTHRIIEFEQREFESGFVTKGDANDSTDSSLVSEKNILGKVFFNIPYLGYLIEASRQPYGFLALIMIPAAIIVYDETVKIVKEIKKIRSGRLVKI